MTMSNVRRHYYAVGDVPGLLLCTRLFSNSYTPKTIHLLCPLGSQMPCWLVSGGLWDLTMAPILCVNQRRCTRSGACGLHVRQTWTKSSSCLNNPTDRSWCYPRYCSSRCPWKRSGVVLVLDFRSRYHRHCMYSYAPFLMLEFEFPC